MIVVKFLLHSGWDVFTLKYDVEEPVATVLDAAAMKAYLRVFKLLWALKRAEHALNSCWVDLNSLQRQLASFERCIKVSGMQTYSEPPLLSKNLISCTLGLKEAMLLITRGRHCSDVICFSRYGNCVGGSEAMP